MKHKAGEVIGFGITLDNALPTGMELYAVISDRGRLRAKVFSTEDSTISVSNAGWTQFYFKIPAEMSVAMIGDWKLELKIKSTGTTDLIVISDDVVLKMLPSAAGIYGITPSDTLPTYTNTYSRVTGDTEPTTANVVISSGVFGVGTAEASQSATVTFRQWLKGEKGDDGEDGEDGEDGAEGLGILYSSQTGTTSSTTSLTKSLITVPTGHTLKTGDLIIAANKLYIAGTVGDTAVAVTYLCNLGEGHEHSNKSVLDGITSAMVDKIGKAVITDAQELTDAQMAQVRTNIGADDTSEYTASEVAALCDTYFA